MMLGDTCLGLVYDSNIGRSVYTGGGARVLLQVSWCCARIIVSSKSQTSVDVESRERTLVL
jgi:hypothetical protein